MRIVDFDEDGHAEEDLLRSTDSFHNKERRDIVLYRNYRRDESGKDVDPDSIPPSASDSGLGYFIGEILQLFAMNYNGTDHHLALIRRYPVSTGPDYSKAWHVSPDWSNWAGTLVIRVGAIVRSGHLIPQPRLGEDAAHKGYFNSYFVNNFLDRDTTARIPDCVDGVFTGVGLLNNGDGDNGGQAGTATRKRRRGENEDRR